jgi:hypothetical protein
MTPLPLYNTSSPLEPAGFWLNPFNSDVKTGRGYLPPPAPTFA